MSRVRLILVALLFCCAIHVEVEATYDECSTRLAPNPQILAKGRVLLSSYTNVDKGLFTDQCFKVVCGGSAFPHRRIIWYRLVDNNDNSSGEPIVSYWSKENYYDTIVNTTGGPSKISSSLIIPKFNKAYMGKYYCIITNGEDTVKSPMISITLVDQGDGYYKDVLGPSPIPTVTPPPPQLLLVLNIKAVIINDSSLLISWNTTQRHDKFCRILQEEEDRKEVYTWTLQVLEWPNYTALANNTSYEDIITGKYFSLFEKGRTIMLKRLDCRNMNYLYRNISSSFYYKFQLVVEKHRRVEKYAGKTVTQNGSYIHHFGELTPPKILYPTPLLRVCKPFDLNICKVTGNPPPHVRLYQPVQNNNIYGCLAENVHLCNSGEVRKLSVNVEFSWDIDTCTPTEPPTSPPQPSCPRPSSDSICGRIFSQDSMVYVPGGSDINRLEQRAEDNINQLKNGSGFCYNQMVKLICYSFLAPCYMDTGKPTSVCPESCQAIMAQCHSTTFNNVLENLPEWSPSRNCSKLEAIPDEECIHLSVPSVERENFTDGSCVIGRGSQYTGNSSTTGCISWDDPRQIFFDTSIFTELKSAGASCRNPGWSKEHPWCYVNLTSGSSDNWKYCKCPPPGHPRNFNVTHSVFYGTTIELKFSWEPPSTGDPVDSYWIRCNKSVADGSSNPSTETFRIPTSHLMAIINADPFTAYHCHSFASNDIGYGPFSRTVSISPIPLASSPVHTLSAMPLNYSHIQLSWNKPSERNNYVYLYWVTLRNHVPDATRNFTSPLTSLVVEALTGNTLYSFDVVAITVFKGEILNSNVTSITITTQPGNDGISSGFIIIGGVAGVVIILLIMIIVLCAIIQCEKNLRKICSRKKPLNHFYDQVFYHRTKVNTGNTVDDKKTAHASVVANVTKLNDENIYDIISIQSQYDPAYDSADKDPTTAHAKPSGKAKYGVIYQPQCEDPSSYQDPSYNTVVDQDPNYNTVVDQDPSYDRVVHQNASYDPVFDQEPTTAHAEVISENKYGVINEPQSTFADQDSTCNVFQYPTCDAVDKDPTTAHTELTGEAKYGVINQPLCDGPNFDTINQDFGDTVVDQEPTTIHTEIFSGNKYSVINQPRCDDPTFADQGHAYDVIIQSQSDPTCDTIEKDPTNGRTKLAGEAKYGVINQPRCDDLNFDTIDQDRGYDIAADQEPTIAYTDKVKHSIIDQQKCTFADQDPPTTHAKPTGEEKYGVINQPQCNDPSADTVRVDPDPATKSSPFTPRLTDQGKHYGVINQLRCNDLV